MARRPSVRYYPSRQAYGCTYQGRQFILAKGPDDFPDGPTYRAALAAFMDLSSLGQAKEAGQSNTVQVIAEKYITHLMESTKKKPATVAIRKRYLGDFINGGHKLTALKNLTHADVYDFCSRMRMGTGKKLGRAVGTRNGGQRHCWTDGSVRNCIQTLQACFNWAVRTGYLTSNPLTGIEVPNPRTRGRRILITPGEQTAILGTVSSRCGEMLLALDNCGARPGELIGAKGADFSPVLGAIVYHADSRKDDKDFSHKTGAKGRDRVIYFTGETLDMVRRLAMKAGPSGHIFSPSVSKAGKRARGHWTLKGLGQRMDEARTKLGWTKPLSPYCYRHTFAARMLEAGLDIETLAVLMGTSAMQIRNHYGHLADSSDHLRRRLEQAMGNGGTSAGPAQGAAG